MKSLRTGVLGIALLALGAAGAGAEGVAGRSDSSIKDAAYAAPTFVWNGLYVGGAVGYGVGGSEFSGEGVSFFDVNLKGAQGIGTIGFDFRLSSVWVLGLFADYAFGDVGGGFGERSTIDRQWAVGGRLGVLATPSTLLYASAGYTAADFKFIFDGPERKGSLDGFFVGIGVEQAFSRRLSLKLDYRFSDYGDFDPGPDFGPGAKYENEVHSVRLGINYRFGN